MFSPYYASARRRRADVDPLDHVAINVALYGVRSPGWAMTERGRHTLTRTADRLQIGPSAMQWRADGSLRISIDEITVPLPRRLRGTVILTPAARFATIHPIDRQGRHRWQPLAPCARVQVAFDRPAWSWSGHGYLDSNDGDGPLEDAFSRWDWSRVLLEDGATTVLYDALRSDGSRLALAQRFTPDGRAEPLPMPPAREIAPGLWRMHRTTHADAGAAPRLLRALEDAPFYTRSVIATELHGAPCTGIQESLSLDRFRQRWVQALLPFRTPRRAGAMGVGSNPSRTAGLP